MTMSSDQERMLKRFMKKSKTRGHDEKEYKSHRLLRKFMKKKAKTQKVYKKHEFLRFIVEAAMKREKMDIDTDDHIDRKIQKKIKILRKQSRPILVDQLQSKKPVFNISYQPPLRKKESNFRAEVVEVEEKREKMDIDTDDHIDRKIQKKIKILRKQSRPILVDQLQSKKPVFNIPYQPPLRKKEANFKEVVQVEEEKVVLVSNDVDDDDYEKEVKNKKALTKKSSNHNKGKKTCNLPAEPPNEEICKLMLEKISEIKGLDPIWLSSKIMTVSDQDAGLGRYFIPRSKELVEFLTKEELNIIEDGIPCRTLDQNGERWDLVFKYYDCLHQYAFLGSWRSLLSSFGLLRPKAKPKTSKNAPKPKEDDVPEVQIPGGKIDLWCFRLPDKDSSLSFALRITRL